MERDGRKRHPFRRVVRRVHLRCRFRRQLHVSLTVERPLTLEFLASGRNLLLCGTNGLGKTLIAKNIAHAAVSPATGCFFTPPPICSPISMAIPPAYVAVSSAFRAQKDLYEKKGSNLSQQFKDRGISTDSNLLPDYMIDLHLRNMMAKGLLKPNSIHRVAIVLVRASILLTKLRAPTFTLRKPRSLSR